MFLGFVKECGLFCVTIDNNGDLVMRTPTQFYPLKTAFTSLWGNSVMLGCRRDPRKQRERVIGISNERLLAHLITIFAIGAAGEQP